MSEQQKNKLDQLAPALSEDQLDDVSGGRTRIDGNGGHKPGDRNPDTTVGMYPTDPEPNLPEIS